MAFLTVLLKNGLHISVKRRALRAIGLSRTHSSRRHPRTEKRYKDDSTWYHAASVQDVARELPLQGIADRVQH
jgi:hypothetical protein